MPLSRSPLTVPILQGRSLITGIAVIGWVLAGAAAAEPFIPDSDSQVLQRLPLTRGPLSSELDRMRKQLAQNPADLDLATRLAGRYIEIGRADADPRYQGYAQAALRSWWDQARPPPQVLVLRATLRQNRHDFQGALEDLAKVLEVQPYNAQAWLTRSVILTVRGDYPQALRSCLPLSRLTPGLPASACIANAVSLNGQAEQGYRLLHQALEDNPSADVRMRLWALTLLAEIAARLGHDQAAERHFEQALNLELRDSYLLGAYADFLLDRDRPAKVRDLLKDEVRADGLLLRLALAEQRLGSAQLNAHVEELQARFQAARLRGDELHLGNEARFTLHLLNNPTEALDLGLQNWAVQREPIDARLVLEAALAAAHPESAQPVLKHLAQTGLEDVRLANLARRLGKIQP